MFKKYLRLIFFALATMSFTLLGYMYTHADQQRVEPLPLQENLGQLKKEKDCDQPPKIETKIVEVLVTPVNSPVQVPQKSLNDFLKRYPFFLDCNKTYNPWTFTGKPTPADPQPFDYAQAAPELTYELRMTRGFLVYFPVDKVNDYMLEFKWLYRSWIEMQKHEPTKWRTDIIVFIDRDETLFKNKDLFFHKLNCSFEFRRRSSSDAPMCTLMEYKSLRHRDLGGPEAAEKIKQFKLLPAKKRYEVI